MNTAALRQYICRACGHVYDEALGDPDGGLPPGTRLQDIPDDWACPLCGVTKADFEPHDSATVAARLTSDLRPGVRGRRQQAGVVIVGGGTAAWTLAEQIRALDAERPLTLVSACSADRYDKPRLSVALRQGASADSLPFERGTDAAARLGVRLWADTAAVGVQMATRRLRTTRGTIAFDELVLAHGALAQPCGGLPADLAWRINDLKAYAGLRKALARASTAERPARVVIVGSGLVGCELANDLALAGHPVTLVDRAARPLPMATEQQCEQLLQAWQALPITFVGSASILGVKRGPSRTLAASNPCGSPEEVELMLNHGCVLRAEVLISAVGLHTPTRLARQAGLQWSQGIAVDASSLDTGVPHVHALGDCISINGKPQRFIEPIRRQAKTVAARVCGAPPMAYDARLPPIRVKTSSCPLTLAA